MDAVGAWMAGGTKPVGTISPKGPAPTGGKVDNQHAAKEVEALFVTQMIKAMRATLPKSDLLSGGRGEEIMRSFQDEALAKSIAERGSFGIAEHMLATLDAVNPQGSATKTHGKAPGAPKSTE